ncbi:MAG TPA: aldo/keto reductase [Pirellulales bacterium]|nr:aldo/keto reductase [Pirellulales bacterium]
MTVIAERRQLGTTDLYVSPIALGCWPIAGMTSLAVNDADSLATISACFDLGINFLDTAYCYGADGESERLIARALGSRRDEIVIATKGGIHWDADGKQVVDGRPERLRFECEESLRRLETDHVELLYLHAPDPKVPIAESAGALNDLMSQGKTRAVGLSNASVEQLKEFSQACRLSAYQPKYNMLQREIEASQLPWCCEHRVSVMVYWPLLKGLLTGKFARDHVFDPRDGRLKYPMFQDGEWLKNQDFIDELRPIAREAGKTVAQVVLQWTIQQSGITSALCGAKRREQIADNAGGAGWELSEAQSAAIARALERRGTPASKGAV